MPELKKLYGKPINSSNMVFEYYKWIGDKISLDYNFSQGLLIYKSTKSIKTDDIKKDL